MLIFPWLLTEVPSIVCRICWQKHRFKLAIGSSFLSRRILDHFDD